MPRNVCSMPTDAILAKIEDRAVVFEKPVTLKTDEELRVECA